MEVSRQLHVCDALPPEKHPPVPIVEEAGWATHPIWTVWSREKSLAPVGNESQAVQSVALRYTDWAKSAHTGENIHMIKNLHDINFIHN
jgi:hypothetical protein